MKKTVIIIVISTTIFFASCNREKVFELSNPDMLVVVLSYNLMHLQSDKEIKLFKKYKIKSVAFVSENIKSGARDSSIFLEYNKDGKILQRTTSECTTAGCLPYVIRQIFTYSDSRIKTMSNYTFNNNHISTNEKWHTSDLSILTKFDWEDYSYNGDTITVESGPTIHKYIHDNYGKPTGMSLRAKTNNQTVKTSFEYSDSSIVILSKVDNSNNFSMSKLVVLRNKVLYYKIADSVSHIFLEFIFNTDGLLETKNYYDKEGELSKRTLVSYTYW
jgi:hypothetical protein